MGVNVRLIQKSEISILEKLLQLYLHDISLYFPIDFNDEIGMYKYDSLSKYFDDENHYPYFIEYDNHLAGFALIDILEDKSIVQEMFVMNNYKSMGIGKAAIYVIFNTYKGNWIIRSVPNSLKSENFWNKTIKKYTCNNYQIEHTGKYNRAVFSFNNME